ncbi:MAG TPA: hypothetical protein VK777_24525 [Reyranella sp.]|jgi:hypothetical protein|nr:hypothetical protein [Reyranella sp.]
MRLLENQFKGWDESGITCLHGTRFASIVPLILPVLVRAQALPAQFRDREAIGLLIGQPQHDESLADSRIDFGIGALLQKIEELPRFSIAQRRG